MKSMRYTFDHQSKHKVGGTIDKLRYVAEDGIFMLTLRSVESVHWAPMMCTLSLVVKGQEGTT